MANLNFPKTHPAKIEVDDHVLWAYRSLQESFLPFPLASSGAVEGRARPDPWPTVKPNDPWPPKRLVGAQNCQVDLPWPEPGAQ